MISQIMGDLNLIKYGKERWERRNEEQRAGRGEGGREGI
jgi:hypothetical protein